MGPSLALQSVLRAVCCDKQICIYVGTRLPERTRIDHFLGLRQSYIDLGTRIPGLPRIGNSLGLR